MGVDLCDHWNDVVCWANLCKYKFSFLFFVMAFTTVLTYYFHGFINDLFMKQLALARAFPKVAISN